jgi:NAD(P)-dependent dehydrogenase (short-subunit alcohol dehydrogenase family)
VRFAREGADVAIAYLVEERDAEATKAAVEKEGRCCVLISGDVRDPRFCRAVVAQAQREFGRLGVLVNNAAFQLHTARFEDLTEDHLDQTVKTNLYGYVYMAQACIEHMQAGAAIEHRVGHRSFWEQDTHRLFDDERRYSRFHAFAGDQSGRAGFRDLFGPRSIAPLRKQRRSRSLEVTRR